MYHFQFCLYFSKSKKNKVSTKKLILFVCALTKLFHLSTSVICSPKWLHISSIRETLHSLFWYILYDVDFLCTLYVSFEKFLAGTVIDTKDMGVQLQICIKAYHVQVLWNKRHTRLHKPQFSSPNGNNFKLCFVWKQRKFINLTAIKQRQLFLQEEHIMCVYVVFFFLHMCLYVFIFC